MENYPVTAMHVYAHSEYCFCWNSVYLDVVDGTLHSYVAGVVLKQNGILHTILVKFDHSCIGCDVRSCSKYKHISNDSVPIEKMGDNIQTK